MPKPLSLHHICVVSDVDCCLVFAACGCTFNISLCFPLSPRSVGLTTTSYSRLHKRNALSSHGPGFPERSVGPGPRRALTDPAGVAFRTVLARPGRKFTSDSGGDCFCIILYCGDHGQRCRTVFSTHGSGTCRHYVGTDRKHYKLLYIV